LLFALLILFFFFFFLKSTKSTLWWYTIDSRCGTSKLDRPQNRSRDDLGLKDTDGECCNYEYNIQRIEKSPSASYPKFRTIGDFTVSRYIELGSCYFPLQQICALQVFNQDSFANAYEDCTHDLDIYGSRQVHVKL